MGGWTGGWVSDYNAPSGPQLNSWSWVEFSWVGQLGPGVAKIELRAESLGTFFTEKSLEAPIFSYTGQTLQHGHWTFLPIFTKIGYKMRPLDVFCSFSALFGGGGSNVWPLLQKNVLVTCQVLWGSDEKWGRKKSLSKLKNIYWGGKCFWSTTLPWVSSKI